MIVGIIYGEAKEINGHYRRITDQYHFPVVVGREFWHRLTGDEDFYQDLIHCIGEVANESDFKEDLERVIAELAARLEI